MKNEKTKKRILFVAYSAISTALVFLTTFVVKIPDVTSSGYNNLGDATIIVIASLLGPLHGLFAGAIGSMLADIAAGYAYYAPFTLVIKGLEGFIVGIIVYKTKEDFQKYFFKNETDDPNFKTEKLKKFKKFLVRLIIAEVIAFVLVVLLYYLAKSTIYSVGIRTLSKPKDPSNLVKSSFIYAAASIPGNLMQMTISVIVSSALVIPLTRRLKPNLEK